MRVCGAVDRRVVVLGKKAGELAKLSPNWCAVSWGSGSTLGLILYELSK